MICTSCKYHFRLVFKEARLLALSRRSGSLPSTPLRSFSASSSLQSHIGSEPLSIPPGVTVRVLEARQGNVRLTNQESSPSVEIEGPLGKLAMSIPSFFQIKQDSNSNRATVSILDRQHRHQKAMWGTTRAHLQNHIIGVSEGHTTILRLVGVGYRASVEENATTKAQEYVGQKFISLKVGFSHPIELGIPQGVKASTPQPTRILLEGAEKEVVNLFAAKIRKWRPPEPYKGKGIFVNDETIRLKNKKIK